MAPLLKPEVKRKPSFQHVFLKFHQHLLYFRKLKIKTTDLGKQKHINLQAGAGKFGQTIEPSQTKKVNFMAFTQRSIPFPEKRRLV